MEFTYLIPGHTHDIIDAIFALVSKALHGRNFHSLPEMMQILSAHMSRPPAWKHLRDYWDFKNHRPKHFTSDHIHGVTAPHHFRLFWSQAGHLCIQVKKWLTDKVWEEPIEMVHHTDIPLFLNDMPQPIEPEWGAGVEGSTINWLTKLQSLYEAMGRTQHNAAIQHSISVMGHKDPAYLPSGVPLATKLRELRSFGIKSSISDVDPMQGILAKVEQAARRAFPGSSTGNSGAGGPPCFKISRGPPGEQPFCEIALSEGMYVVYRPTKSDPRFPIQFGRIERVVAEADPPYAVVQTWWPILKAKHDYRANIFGTWLWRREPLSIEAEGAKKKKPKVSDEQNARAMIPLGNILVWPVHPEGGNEAYPDGFRIPFLVFDYVLQHHGIDIVQPTYTWSTRGREFWDRIIKFVGARLREDQNPS